jgi:hypothetical protein
MALLILSNIPAFAEVLIFCQLSWPAASDSWNVAVISDVKHKMHGLGMHAVGVCSLTIRSIGVNCMNVHTVDMPGMGMYER